MRPFFLFTFFAPIFAFNPCLLDETTCVAFEDFDVNCTCVLLPDNKSINITDQVYLWFSGFPISMDFIKNVPMEKLYREKLSVRIPQSRYYDFHDEFSENIYRNMDITENMALFLIDTTKSKEMLDYLVDNKIIRTSGLSKTENSWCLEGECNAFVHESQILNRTQGIYAHAADLLQIIEYRGKSIFAISSVFGVFSVPKAQQLQCEHRCKLFHWGEKEMCRKECVLKLRYDQVAITGDLKRNFDFFVQSSAIQNFRQKYYKYVKNYPSDK